MLVEDLKQGDRLFCIPVWVPKEYIDEFQFEIYEVKEVYRDPGKPFNYIIKSIPIIGEQDPYLVLPEDVELNDIVTAKYYSTTWIWTTNEDLAVKLFRAFSEDTFEAIMNIYFYLDGYYNMNDIKWCTDLESIYR